MLLCLNNMFFLIPFVSDSFEEPSQQIFVLVKTYWRRLEDVLETSWRRLQGNIFCFIRCLENVLKTSCKEILKTSWRNFEDVFGRRIANTSWRRLGDVLEDENLLRWRRLEDVLETSWKTRNACRSLLRLNK